ncbi:MAG: tetratricopeptide repeat protein, partial [Planctomycetota bacterium]|nr:tetratricopeptide repeat protein [Planctomycetota bacterium]
MTSQQTSDEPKDRGIFPSSKSMENISVQWFVSLVVRGKTRLFVIATWLTLATATSSLCWSTDLDDVRQLINSGKYEEAEAFSNEQVGSGIWNEKWPKTLIECLLVQGKAQPANEIYQAAIKRYPTSLSLRLMGVDVLRQCGLKDEADAASRQILLLMQSAPSRYASRDNLIAMGQYFASQGEDARQILELFYDRVRDSDPTHLGACLASAELALSKNDFKVAAETLKRGLEIAPDDPNVHYYLARTWASSDRKRSGEALNKALQLNPRHPPSLLIKAERAIDAEQYEAAALVLEIITTLNPNHQQAIALRAVLAHLRGDFQQEEKLREEALKTWSTNPKVDHLIGRKLSDKYRFEEGAAYQRRALELDSGYLPAKFQLAQDLLRLGQDQVGWELAKQVANEDPYNVVAVNLLNLNRRIDQFTTVESNGIRLRMAFDEAPIYGQQVMDLLA